MGWLQLVGSLKSLVFFAENSLFYRALLQKRPIILRSLLIVATPYTFEESDKVAETHVYIHKCMYIYACIYVLLYIYKLHIHIYILMCIGTDIYVYVYTYVHIHILGKREGVCTYIRKCILGSRQGGKVPYTYT